MQPGDRLGRFVLERVLGKGSHGTVFAATDTALAERVAVKLIHRDIAQDAGLQERLRREVALARRIAHPGVCRFFDLHIDGDVVFVTMALIEGPTLQEALRGGAFAAERATPILVHLCEAMAAAHAVGVIHRDLKPANIILGPHDSPVILDFGIALARDSTRLTDPGLMLGSLRFMAPELFAGAQPTPATDVYALGITAYAMLKGRLPYEVEQFRRDAAEVFSTPPAPLPESVPRALRDVVLRAMEPVPARRYATAMELAAALHAAQTLDDLPYAPAASAPENDDPTRAMRRTAAARAHDETLGPRVTTNADAAASTEVSPSTMEEAAERSREASIAAGPAEARPSDHAVDGAHADVSFLGLGPRDVSMTRAPEGQDRAGVLPIDVAPESASGRTIPAPTGQESSKHSSAEGRGIPAPKGQESSPRSSATGRGIPWAFGAVAVAAVLGLGVLWAARDGALPPPQARPVEGPPSVDAAVPLTVPLTGPLAVPLAGSTARPGEPSSAGVPAGTPRAAGDEAVADAGPAAAPADRVRPPASRVSVAADVRRRLDAVRAGLKRKGVRLDDVPGLVDGLSTATEAARKGELRAAQEATQTVENAAARVAVDRAFVARKVRRFNAAFEAAARARPALRPQVSSLANRATEELAAGDDARANATLNAAYRLIEGADSSAASETRRP